MSTIYRQGDLTFILRGDPVAGPDAKDRILALGEESGHWHEAVGGIVVDQMVEGVRFLDVFEETVIVVRPDNHAHRHEPVVLPPGRYEIPGQADTRSRWLGQREYTPQGIRGSAD